MSEKEQAFRAALQGKQIPILTLDHKWHKLLTQADTPEVIFTLEEKLNELLKRQGKLNTDSKSIRMLKAKLMKEIVNNMEASDQGNKTAVKEMDEKKRLINECNDKLEQYQDELLDIPKEISEVNFELMIETMNYCYEMIQENTAEMKEITDWIHEIKNELKQKVIRKQEKELKNQQVYKYMHETFGSEVIELFDLKYSGNPSQNIKEEKTEQERK